MFRRPTRSHVLGLCLVGTLTLVASSEQGRGQDADKPPVNATFVNQTGGPVELFWVGPDEEKSFGVIEDGKSKSVSTYLGHVWSLRDAGKKERMRYTATIAGSVTNVVGGRPANPAPSPTPAPSPAPASGSATTETGSAITDAEMNELLALHNKARKEVGVEPIKWSPKLAKFAQAWADECVRTGNFEHRPRKGPLAQMYGENIAGFRGSVAGEKEGAMLWYDEKPLYTPGTPFDPKSEAGHYTQMVWRKSMEFGAGKAQYKSGPNEGMWILIGNYNPAGNMSMRQRDGTVVGEKPY